MTSENAPAVATQLIAERTIAATPPAIFALLTDPARHHHTEPTDWVRGSLEESPPPITEVDQVFGIEMFHVNAGGRYEMHNRVTVLDPGRAIAWEPSQYSPEGVLEGGGWFWRYDLEPVDEGTRVRLTYDWAATPPEIAEQIGGLPSVDTAHLDRSLASLAQAVESGRS